MRRIYTSLIKSYDPRKSTMKYNALKFRCMHFREFGFRLRFDVRARGDEFHVAGYEAPKCPHYLISSASEGT